MDDCEPKKVGRLLKKGSVLSEKVRITDYNFSEIRVTPVVYSDNTESNVIHSSLHDPEELAEGVLGYPSLAQDFGGGSMSSSIQFPRNFTKDWLKDKSKAKRKGQSIFEDDDEEDEEFHPVQLQDTDGSSGQGIEDTDSSKTPEISDENVAGDHHSPSGEGGGINSSNSTVIPNSPEKLAQLQQNSTSLDDSFQMVGNAIKEMGATAISQHEEKMAMDSSPPTLDHVSSGVHRSKDLDGANSSLNSAETDGSDPIADDLEDFVPSNTTESENGSSLEDSAIAEYHRKKIVDEIDVEGIREEAKARGYEDGFRVGEERATIQYHQKSEELFSTVEELLLEFGNLKSDILANVQENFLDLSTALCESLVGRSIDLDPEVFVGIMRRAISEAVDGDIFTIFVSETMNELLGKIDIGDLAGSIKVDSKMSTRDFRVESKLGVVDSGVHRIISDLLEEANVQLFESEQKAG